MTEPIKPPQAGELVLMCPHINEGDEVTWEYIAENRLRVPYDHVPMVHYRVFCPHCPEDGPEHRLLRLAWDIRPLGSLPRGGLLA